MSKVHICDYCSKKLNKGFSDEYYEVKKRFSIKKVFNAYDGFQPWKVKKLVDLCEDCFFNALDGIGLNKKGKS